MPLTPPKSAFLPTEEEVGEAKEIDARHSVWSDSQISEKLSAPIKRSVTNSTRRPIQPRAGVKSGRSYSFSTVDDHHKISAETQDRTLRIVIDRSAPQHPATTQSFALPSLSVPIPHFRLGKPVFSTYGTAALRTSAIPSEDTGITPESETENFIFPAPPKSRPTSRSLSEKKHLETRSSIVPASGKNRLGRGVEDSMQPDSEPRIHILPGIFDDLSQRRDDPSLVRYSNSTGEISAATPARIIAQISSESFMDYELVSDFFLTFRSYLSTNDVLDLLLARLRWAIGRLEEDGRVVRIRTFAALRHWILNYFMDDFVVNRSLRVRFCNEINSMYHEVGARVNGGGSDLKILQDLKRCWNGRCSLYWDSPQFSVDIPHHFDIVPGGVLGSRVSTPIEFAKIEIIRQEKPKDAPQTKKQAARQSWFGAPAKARKASDHKRQASETSASVKSEQSIQPTSCSIPARLAKRSGSTSDRGRSPQPASVQMRRRKAPSNLALAVPNEHPSKDGVQQPVAPPTHLSSPSKPSGDRGQPAIPFESNFIRGQLLPPASALIEVLPPTSAAPDMSTFDLGVSEPSQFGDRDSRSSGKASPAMKGMLGSIRRALSTRPAHGPISAPTQIHVSALHGRTAALPLTVAKSTDNLRVNTNAQPVRSKLRIDLLCAAVVQSYERAISAAGPIGLAVSPDDDLLRPGRLASNLTAQSGSILIVDDTGLDMPVMSGALPASQSHNVHFDISDSDLSSAQGTHLQVSRHKLASQHSQSSSYLSTSLTAEKLSQNDLRRSLPLTAISQDISLPARTSSLHYNRQHASTASSTTLRRHGSIMSSNGQGKDPSINATTMTLSSGRESADEENAKGPPPMLRRRPGGDLRNNESVHDLETSLHHDSLDSDMTGGSLVIMGNSQTTANRQPTGPKPISMINTHSSQHLRPSFEAVVAGFSAIPDDDDGGIEATLLKLEGSYERTSPALSQEEADEALRKIQEGERDTQAEAERKRHRQQHAQEAVPEDVAAMPALDDLSDNSSGKGKGPAEKRITATRMPMFALPDDSESGSHDSYNSTPLLEREVSDRPIRLANPTASKQPSAPPGLGMSTPALEHPASPGHSFEMVEETDSMKQANRTQESSARSFYYEEDEMLSDLSSEISVDVIHHSDADRAFSPMFAAPGTAMSGLELPSHPLAHSPTTSFALHRLGTPTAARGGAGPQMPLTPDTSPLQEHMTHDNDSFLDEMTTPRRKEQKQESVRLSSSPGHIPFILACDSIVLAQQFTLVEQAALTEVDWSDLVEMRWDNKSANIHDWVEYICKQDNKGVDLVITRFNLVVKWTLSEIVMTQDINERARVLAKFIHIAAHCRRLHNYATMLQITIALTSIDCARLTKTWQLVSSPDHSLLKNMEALIQPVRNFHDLRNEMESSDLTEGCIPFIGLYVHDLTYNAQKPAQIATSRDGEPLINFARYRTAATIIKGLLRLIDASARYEFAPVEGVLERCLWLASLSDGRIREMSKSLEA
jgi:RasGEF domain/RasGEF N-terminal motif